jgi:adenosylcobinamide kinase/adenosylcobinamide-phosphate guanylyltransferase
MGRIVLFTGGGRSGKSRQAMERALAYPAPRAFIATAEPLDDEMRERIERHRRERGGTFETIEEPVDLAGALRRVRPGTTVALIDCLTVWLGNVMHRRGEAARDYPEIAAFVAALKEMEAASSPPRRGDAEDKPGVLPSNSQDTARRLGVSAVTRAPSCDLIIVTNEVGMGIIPADNELSRRFRDQAGWLNQAVAEIADEVVLVVSGIPVVIKDKVQEGRRMKDEG